MGDDINYGEIFGVEISEPDSGAEAEPENDAGAKEQEVTDPADESEDSGNDIDGEGEGAVQSAEENAKYAAARRKAEAERDAAIAQAKADAKAEAERAINEAYRDLGLIDPYTKRPIETKAEYDAYKQNLGLRKRNEIAQKNGMSEAEFTEFVNNLPEVKSAREKQEQAEAALKQAQEMQAKIKIDDQMKEIGKLDPDVRSLEDLTKMPNYDYFRDLVKRGNTLVEAYKLANMDKLTAASANGAKQAAINAMSGKSHLEKTSGRGLGAATVPREILEQYRLYNPDATDAEIQKHYNKHIKK